MFLLNPYRFGTSGGFLDNLATSPRAVWSLRKLASTATSAIRVRRSNDNAEQDIGFSGSTVGSGLDTSALASFVGSNSAYVKTWYDQTGNGEDATQATASKQPRIVNAGTIQSAITWDGSDDFLQVTSLSNTAAQCGVYMKAKITASGSDSIVFETSANYNSNAGAFLYYYSASGHDFGMSQGGGTRDNRFGSSLSAALTQATALFDRTQTGTSEISFWVAGSPQSPSGISGTENTGNFQTYDFYIGGRAGTTLFTSPQLETLVFYNADTNSLRTSIEAIVA